jgi:regulator-associated protein of mTOR
MTTFAARPKGPQPVLDSLTEPDGGDLSDAPSESRDRPRTAPRLEPPPNGFSNINRSSTQIFHASSRRGSRNVSPAPRPGLLRAKSDFGPRREEVAKAGEEEVVKEPGDGEWGIRHGFETQLESEEYNNLLNSVRTSHNITSYSKLMVMAELLHVLYGQEARDWW